MKEPQKGQAKKVWHMNNGGCVQASVVLTMTAAAKLTARATKLGVRPLDYMAAILEQSAKER